MDRDKARGMGERAALAGKSQDDCPFKAGERRSDWIIAFRCTAQKLVS